MTEKIIRALRQALASLVEAGDSEEELREMLRNLDLLPIPQAERQKMVNAVNALLDTMEYK